MFEGLIWLVPAVVLCAGFWRPSGGLLALAAALPFFGSPPGGPYLAALDVAILAAVATAWRAGPAPPSRLDRPVLVFALVSLASMIPAGYDPPSWQPRILLGLLEALPNAPSGSALYAWRAAANLLLGCSLYFAVRRAFAGRSLRPLGVALASGLAATLVAGLAARGGLLELWSFRPIGGPMWDPRFHSFFFHSGWLAEYLVLAAPLAVAAVAGSKPRQQAIATGLAVVSLAALAFTLQRGAWVTAIVQLASIAILWRTTTADPVRRRRVAAGIAAAALLVTAAVVLRPGVIDPIRHRLTDGQNLSGRWPVWAVSTNMVRERPLLGWGLGSFGPAFEKQDPNKGAGAVYWLTPHNQYLMVAAERGLLGLISFGWLAWALVGCLRRALAREGSESRRLTRGLTVTFVGFAVYSLVQYLFFLKSLEALFWILSGAAAALAPAESQRRPDRALLALALAAVLLVPWRWARLHPVDSPTNGSYGFHWPEISEGREFLWTERKAARRLAWEDEVLVLELANGHPRAGERPLQVTVRVDGQVRSRVTLRGGWEEQRIVLGPPRRDSIVVGLEARPPFRPYREFLAHPGLERSRDLRQLGVALRAVRWEK